jgi:hypothetical protein
LKYTMTVAAAAPEQPAPGLTDEVLKRTYVGQACWGIDGARVCRDCWFYSAKQSNCQKFRELTGRPGAKFPAGAYVCRYFEPKSAWGRQQMSLVERGTHYLVKVECRYCADPVFPDEDVARRLVEAHDPVRRRDHHRGCQGTRRPSHMRRVQSRAR